MIRTIARGHLPRRSRTIDAEVVEPNSPGAILVVTPLPASSVASHRGIAQTRLNGGMLKACVRADRGARFKGPPNTHVVARAAMSVWHQVAGRPADMLRHCRIASELPPRRSRSALRSRCPPNTSSPAPRLDRRRSQRRFDSGNDRPAQRSPSADNAESSRQRPRTTSSPAVRASRSRHPMRSVAGTSVRLMSISTGHPARKSRMAKLSAPPERVEPDALHVVAGPS